MSSKLRLSSPEAISAYASITSILREEPTGISDIEHRSMSVVSYWSKAGLDVYDDIIIPFRSIESQPVLGSVSPEVELNIKSVYRSASSGMLDFIESLQF